MTPSAEALSTQGGSDAHHSPAGGLPIAVGIVDAAVDRNSLRRLLARHPSVEVVFEAASLARAQKALAELKTPLVFVDPAPEAGAVFDWLAQRPSELDVVLVTASDGWAMKAFEIDALDYLTKPVSPDRLSRTIRRLLRLDWNVPPPPGRNLPDRLFVAFERGRRMVAIDEIRAIRAFGNYTQVVLTDGKTEVVMRSLRRWEETLPQGVFLRIHRAVLVNRRSIRQLCAMDGEGGHGVQVDGVAEFLPVSRRFLSSIKAALG